MKRIFSICLVLAMLLGCSALAGVPLNVTGSGTIYMEADLVSASLGVNMSGEDLEVLQKQVNETVAAICEALVAAGLDEKSIATNYLYISPRYDYSGETEAIIGYSINNTLSIRTEDIANIGAYIDAAFAAGANTFDSIEFTVKDDSEARRQALTLAVEDARAKAETIAAAAGKQLNGILSISEGSQSDYSWYNSTSGSVRYDMAAESVAGAGTTVRAAQVKVTADVQVTYDMVGNVY
ncbi:MAG: SIMPL domain-containing protein [Clostridia bacterium]|nr:SIMPL domain-containing protein [Clostridia bacterium]